jgi:N-acetylglucosamine kinase-like BadF-type ATPase
MKYFVGVEGFCMRYSVAVLADGDGNILAAHRDYAALNLHTVEPSELANRLMSLLTTLFTRAGLTTAAAVPESTVCIGIAGVNYSHDRFVVLPTLIREHLDWKVGKLICTGDAEIAFLSHARQCRGSLIISHTGSVAYVVGAVNGVLQHVRYGGWGPQIADEGSGYWIGREVMREICLQHAKGEGPSRLWMEVEEWLHQPLPQTQPWSEGSEEWRLLVEQYQSNSHAAPPDHRTLIYRLAHSLAVSLKHDQCRFVISGLVIPLMRAYRAGDACAIKLLERAVNELVFQYQEAMTIAGPIPLQPDDPIVLYGGVLHHNIEALELLRVALTQALGREPNLRTKRTPGAMRPALGALLYALAGSSTGALSPPCAEVIEKVAQQQALGKWRWALEHD